MSAMKKDDAEEFTQSLGQIVGGSWRQIALAKRLGVPQALGLSVTEWVEKRLGGYVRLAVDERRKAARELANDGESTRDIGEVLGVGQRTAARDLAEPNGSLRAADSSNGAPAESEPEPNGSPMDAVAALAATDKLRAAAQLTQTRQAKEQEREARRDENRAAIDAAPSAEQVSGRFSTIVIDPPWDWGDEGDQDQLGRARPTYGTMSIEQLMALPVGDYADIDCHLYLWITNRSLPKGFPLLERWGFRYVTCLTWTKPSFGMGNYFRGQTEQILFGVRGSQMLKRKDVGTLFSAPRGPRGHSSKPVEFYGLVESCSPGPYLEMFARGGRSGWSAWGAEADAAA